MSLKLKDSVIINKEQFDKENQIMEPEVKEQPKAKTAAMETVKVEGVKVQVPKGSKIYGANKYPDKVVFVWENETTNGRMSVPIPAAK